MKEGTVPVPPNRPCAERDDDVITFSGVVVPFLELHYLFGRYRTGGAPAEWNPHFVCSV